MSAISEMKQKFNFDKLRKVVKQKALIKYIYAVDLADYIMKRKDPKKIYANLIKAKLKELKAKRNTKFKVELIPDDKDYDNRIETFQLNIIFDAPETDIQVYYRIVKDNQEAFQYDQYIKLRTKFEYGKDKEVKKAIKEQVAAKKSI